MAVLSLSPFQPRHIRRRRRSNGFSSSCHCVTKKKSKRMICIAIIAILVVRQTLQNKNNNDNNSSNNLTTAKEEMIRQSTSRLDEHHSHNTHTIVDLQSESINPDDKKKRNAYVFMLWRCQPEDQQIHQQQHQQQPSSSSSSYYYNYRGYLVNVCIASILLGRHGSTTTAAADIDIILVVQLAANSTQSTLNSDEVYLLKQSGVMLRYLPIEKTSTSSSLSTLSTYPPEANYNIFATMFHKFHIYSFVRYEKVFYLDSDILPLNNLDYMFDMMDGDGTARYPPVKAITIGGVFQPANGGFFLIRPNMTDYRQIRQMIKQRGARLGEKESFDPIYGWGHKILPPDQWETNHPRTKGVLWDFWAAHGDQGFLYYYTKYVLRNVTQILSRTIRTLGPIDDNNNDTNMSNIFQIISEWNVTKETPLLPWLFKAPNHHHQARYPFVPTECSFMTGGMARDGSWPGCLPPYSDISHLDQKPWKGVVPPPPSSKTKIMEPTSDVELWWAMFYELREQHRDRIDLMSFLPTTTTTTTTK